MKRILQTITFAILSVIGASAASPLSDAFDSFKAVMPDAIAMNVPEETLKEENIKLGRMIIMQNADMQTVSDKTDAVAAGIPEHLLRVNAISDRDGKVYLWFDKHDGDDSEALMYVSSGKEKVVMYFVGPASMIDDIEIENVTK